MISMLTSLLMSIALSACCGFRIFIPLLLASIAVYFNWIIVPPGYAFLGTIQMIILFALAALIEVLAYYFTFIDNALDTIAGPLAIAAGIILSTGILKIDNDILRLVLGIIAGGTTAGVVQAATTTSRLASTKFTAGFGNGVIATIENIASLLIGVLSIILPIITGIIMCLIIYMIIKKLGFSLWKKNWKHGNYT